jgi:hypothetical protein
MQPKPKQNTCFVFVFFDGGSPLLAVGIISLVVITCWQLSCWQQVVSNRSFAVRSSNQLITTVIWCQSIISVLTQKRRRVVLYGAGAGGWTVYFSLVT